VVGGGASEIEVSSKLKRWADQLSGREQLAATKFAEAMEVIPLTLAENAGLDPIDIITELRASHVKGQKWFGVDVMDGKVKDMSKIGVYEPMSVKEQIISSAGEAASMLLKIDDVIASGKAREPAGPPKPPGGEEEPSEFD